MLDVVEGLLELGLLGPLGELLELVEVREPVVVADLLRDERREGRVALEEPATGRDSVRDVREVVATCSPSRQSALLCLRKGGGVAHQRSRQSRASSRRPSPSGARRLR